MLARIAAFELRSHLRSPVFWIVAAISMLMVFGSVTVERLQIGPVRAGPVNSAFATIQVHLIWTLFFMFTTAAFCADAVVRDEATGFGPIIRTTPVRARDHLLGRFLGAFAAAVLCYLSVPLALALSPLAPWLDPASLAPPRPGDQLYALLALAIPNLFLTSSVFFGLAAATRSAMAAYLGAVALLVLYGLGVEGAAAGPLAALMEPFGFAAYALATQGWSEAERALRLPAFAGPLMHNRLIWAGIGALALALALTAPRIRAPAPSPAALDAAPPPEREPGPLARPRFDRATALAQLRARTRLEMGQVLATPTFAILLALGLANAAGASWSLGPSGDPIERLTQAFRLVPIVVAIVYAGELVWNERERRVHELTGAAPVPDWAFLAPKMLAIALVLAAVLAAGALASALALAAGGRVPPGPGAILAGYLLPQTFEAVLTAILAVFLQAVSPGKLAGWGWMVLYLIVSLGLDEAGLDSALVRYGRAQDSSVPGGDAALLRAYWSAFALMLLVLAGLLLGRGTEARLRPRLARLPGRLRGPAGLLLGAALLAFAALGLLILSPRGGL